MTFFRFTGLFVLLGIAIPPFFLGLWWAIDHFRFASHEVQVLVQYVMLMLWPTSIFGLVASDAPGLETKVLIISVVANIFFYMLIGVGIWYGLRKHIAFLVPVILVVGTIWWRLLSIH